MAKRNKSEEPANEEDYQFIPPDFDEDHFIHKELVSFHTTVILFFVGIIAAVASWGAFAALDGARTGWLVGMVILALFFGFLRPIFRILNVDIAHWARREWIGTGFLMFFTWLSFFIMLVNPPISDFADPDANLYITPSSPIAGDEARFDLFLHDNDAIDGYDMRITLADGTPFETPALERVAHLHYAATTTMPAGDYVWHVTVHDQNGRSSDETLEFTVTSSGLDVTVDPDDFYPVQANVPGEAGDYWAVYADIEGGDRVYLEYQKDANVWTATTNFKGWNTGNNTFTVTAEERNTFDEDMTLVTGGKLTSGPHTLFVANPGDYDDNIPKRGNPVDPPMVSIPGLELPLLAAGLIAVAFIVRRRS